MSSTKIRRATTLIVVGTLLFSSVAVAGKRAKKAEYTLTEADLQADLMSYADRYASIVAQAIDDVRELEPPPEVRRRVTADLVYSAAAAYTVAADSNPQVALLDMVVLGTLGRMVFEEHWRPRYGAFVDPVVTALNKLELDIWNIADAILSGEQQAELRERIEMFRTDNPELTTFSHLRFADFPSKRQSSTLKQGSGGGIFKSVGQITEQVEQTRMLAERGVYLSTRLPLLSGFFADIWLSELSVNPAVEGVLGDVRTFAGVSERLAAAVEQLPAQVTEERNEAIRQVAVEVAALQVETVDHVFESFAAERENTIQQLVAEEPRLTGVLSELRQTLEAGDELTGSVGELLDKLELGSAGEGAPAAVPEEPPVPFDIDDYRKALVEAGATVRDLDNLVGSAHRLLDSSAVQQMAPQSIVDRVFAWIALLIVITLIGYVAARLAYRWLAVRLFGAA